jgi:hypothetical protein
VVSSSRPAAAQNDEQWFQSEVTSSSFSLGDLPISSEPAIVFVTISQPGPERALQVQGTVEFLESKGGIQRRSLFVNGAKHVLKGPVQFPGSPFDSYGFEADPGDSLVFYCFGDEYSYFNGRGRVRDKKHRCTYRLEEGHALVNLKYPVNTVLDLQRKLSGSGFNPGAIDGVWGAKTWTALKGYQKKTGLPMTGQLDGSTRKTLDI